MHLSSGEFKSVFLFSSLYSRTHPFVELCKRERRKIWSLVNSRLLLLEGEKSVCVDGIFVFICEPLRLFVQHNIVLLLVFYAASSHSQYLSFALICIHLRIFVNSSPHSFCLLGRCICHINCVPFFSSQWMVIRQMFKRSRSGEYNHFLPFEQIQLSKFFSVAIQHRISLVCKDSL